MSFDVCPECRRRKVLMVKGLVFGIPEDKYTEAFAAASSLITREGITTLCWDGDKFTYRNQMDGSPPAASFTRLLVDLQQAMPHLEFIFFKKAGKASGLVSGVGQIEADSYGNVLGPFPFLTPENIVVQSADSAVPGLSTGRHMGIEFSGEMKWYELGLKGLRWVKASLGVARVSYLIFGLGGAVNKELAAVAENPTEYPEGVSLEQATLIAVVRE